MTNLSEIKNWFKTGLKPTQTQFWATWDSFWHKGTPIPQDAIENLENTLINKADVSRLEEHINDASAHNGGSTGNSDLQAVLDIGSVADINEYVFINASGFSLKSEGGFNSTIDESGNNPTFIYQYGLGTRIGNQTFDGSTVYISECRTENDMYGTGRTKAILETSVNYNPIKIEIEGTTGLTIVDNVLSKGASYQNNYASANTSNPRWIPDKAYVDAVAVAAGNRPYKSYTAILSQSGTDAPNATVLENTLGQIVTWDYSAVGKYYAYTSDAFTSGKSVAFVQWQRGNNAPGQYGYEFRGNDSMLLECSTFAGMNSDNVCDAVIEIRVYQ